MFGFTRTKRVTNLLDDKVKARIFGQDRFEPGYISSGSERSAADDILSPSDSDLLLYDSVENDDDVRVSESLENNESDSDRSSLICDSTDVIKKLKRILLHENADLYKNVLEAHVLKAVELLRCMKIDKTTLRRNVMALLRNLGYNAAVCKTKWQSSGSLIAGEYEFIDVLWSNTSTSSRYFIDLDFVSEFEIARPTSSYEKILQTLPNVFVGKSQELKQILKVMSDAARRSLKSRGLHISPWRKHSFMQSKWFGPYKRTSNMFPASFSSPASSNYSFSISCQSIGFNAILGGVNDNLFSPTATCTRC